MPHRPLSAWVAAVPLAPDGVARWDRADDVNFGDERADARALPELAGAWRREAVPVSLGYLALGLVPEFGRAVVLELDDLARPIRVTRAGADVIARIEDGWPGADVSPADATVLAGEEFAVRDLLLTRLVEDGDPPRELFHILPWHQVDRLSRNVTEMLGGAAPGELIELDHWFASAGSRFTAALEQLDEGLRDQDPALARVAATALCTRLLDVVPARLPGLTRTALARLVGSLGQADPFLGYCARRAAARLAPGAAAREARPIRLDTRLAAAADTAVGVRSESRDGAREPFAVQLVVTAAGRVEVVVSAPLPLDLRALVDDAYTVMLLPVKITGEGVATRYLIPLLASGGRLVGRLDLPVPSGRFVAADIDGPPIGVAEAAFLSPGEVRRSIHGLRTLSGRALWNQIAELLPAGNPLRELIAGATE